jgi:NhaA family Na+:H+ antiporter
VGIFLFSFVAIQLGIAKLPKGVSWSILLGGGMLPALVLPCRFLFSELAFGGIATLLASAKIGILLGSFISACLGMAFIRFRTEAKKESASSTDSAE